MAQSQVTRLNPRKSPRQARAEVTVDAIFEATIQVLVSEGPQRLTTTRVAQRAGVSVGTMYQYFANKQSLFYAVNKRYLDVLAEKVESACEAHHGERIEQMIEALVTTYWLAKTGKPEVTHALYRSVADLDNQPLMDAFSARVDAASAAMFATASDTQFDNLEGVNLTLLTVIFGTVRSAFERNMPYADGQFIYQQLVVLCKAYVNVMRRQAA
jgi:AcrR family transcriptional regulator